MEEFKNIPKKGQLFIYSAYNISDIVIKNKENDYMLTNGKIKYDLLKHKYLIFIYLGDGLAREYFSSKIFNVVITDNFDQKNILNKIPTFEDYNTSKSDFYKDYKRVLKHSLLLHSLSYDYSKKMFKLDSDMKNKILNDKDEDQIVETIEQLELLSKTNLINQMNKIINNDYKSALEENRRLKLKKTF